MEQLNFDRPKNQDIAWCPGCGNFMIHRVIKEALSEMGKDPRRVVFSSGIGQAAKMPQYIETNFFNGLHGRALPVATGIKASRPDLLVIAEGGDGDMYGEGGNHFIHTVRRNPDILHVVHNNMVYGLTKGQASPTSPRGFKTPLQVDGVILEPLNPLAVALSLGASFVARSTSAHKEHLKETLKAAAEHQGYALVDVFHPCVSFNKVNTLKWYKENTVILGEEHDSASREAAMAQALASDPYPLGILYQGGNRLPFTENQGAYRDDKTPLWKREPDRAKIQALIDREF